jgi:hypothetical protein
MKEEELNEGIVETEKERVEILEEKEPEPEDMRKDPPDDTTPAVAI